MTSLMTTEQMLGSLQQAKTNLQTHKVRSGGLPFLRLDKHGDGWSYGVEQDPVEKEDLWAVDPRSLSIGYAAWTDKPRKNVAEVSWSVFEPPIHSENFPEIPDNADWSEQRSMHLTCAKGPSKGQAVVYSNGSQGGMERFDELADEIIARAAAGSRDFVPLVKLEHDSYQHKAYGRIYKPVFTVVEWVSLDQGPEDVEEVEPEPEPEPEATNPRQRKRRRRNAA